MAINEIKIQWKGLFKPIPGLKTDQLNHIVIEREAIPIIFIPGFMGSRLREKHGSVVWDPDSRLFMFNTYGWRNVDAIKKKKLLIGEKYNPNRLEVYDKIDDNGEFIDYPQAKSRGWGGIAWDFYGKLIVGLEDNHWTEPIRHCFEFPVHAFAYNWTNSNREEGKKLKDFIVEVKKKYENRNCKQVILVTHSMGGLVARSACFLHDAKDDVLGIIHGVQPAVGAASAYWKMKAGVERQSSQSESMLWHWISNPVKIFKNKSGGIVTPWVLGTNGQEVTALISFMPGGLELLPTNDYTDNDGSPYWITYKDIHSDIFHGRPSSGDVYQEIYREKVHFYRSTNPDWVAPDLPRVVRIVFRRDPWTYYDNYLTIAESFHQDLQKQFHDETYQFLSKNLNTVDRIVYQCELSAWNTKIARVAKIAAKSFIDHVPWTAAKWALFNASPIGWTGLAKDAASAIVKNAAWAIVKVSDAYVNRGGCREYIDEEYRIIGPESDEPGAVYSMTFEPAIFVEKNKDSRYNGDGTVSLSSAQALSIKAKEDGPQRTISIGKDDEIFLDREHANIYNTQTAQKIVIRAIENMCLKKIKNEIK